MLFADFFNELLGQACLMFVGVLFLIGWGLKALGGAVSNAMKNETVRDAAKIGFWSWFLSDE